MVKQKLVLLAFFPFDCSLLGLCLQIVLNWLAFLLWHRFSVSHALPDRTNPLQLSGLGTSRALVEARMPPWGCIFGLSWSGIKPGFCQFTGGHYHKTVSYKRLPVVVDTGTLGACGFNPQSGHTKASTHSLPECHWASRAGLSSALPQGMGQMWWTDFKCSGMWQFVGPQFLTEAQF